MGGPLAHNKYKKRERFDRSFGLPRRNEVVVRDRVITPIPKSTLVALYVQKKKSMAEIAVALRCSRHKVAYWMELYKIRRRPQSEATYVKRNPNGDPFAFKLPATMKEAELFGLGIGLFWGEGTKAEKTTSVRLGNSDPALIRRFVEFLMVFFSVKKDDMRFGLQLFSDVSVSEALDFWGKELRIGKKQFYKVIVTPSRGRGTYGKKSRFGVLTVYYNNKKLKDKLIALLPM